MNAFKMGKKLMMKFYVVRWLAKLICFFFLSGSMCFAQNREAPPTSSSTALTVNTLDITASASSSVAPIVRGLASERLFKKKILATAFTINKSAQVMDIDHIEQGFPRELLNKLDHSRQFLIRSSPDLLSFSNEVETPSVRLVKQVAAENDSQFVISGDIRNAGIRVDRKYFGLWRTNKRQIEVGFAVYDGLSGAMLAQHVLHKEAEDEAIVGRDKPFGSAIFYSTSYGKAIDALLLEAARLISADLESHAVLAKILKISNGQIVIDAGKTSAIFPGDLAIVAVVNNELPIMGLTSAQSQPLRYGLPQSSLGKIAIIQSQQLFSVGELSADLKADDVKVGDFVRFDNVMAN